jgi:hypothetical protein
MMQRSSPNLLSTGARCNVATTPGDRYYCSAIFAPRDARLAVPAGVIAPTLRRRSPPQHLTAAPGGGGSAT